MSVTVQDEHLAVGAWNVEADWSLGLLDELTEVVDSRRRPRKVHALVYDTSTDPPTLIYCGPLLRVAGGKEGLSIGGRGLLWWMGAGDDGALIDDQEFIAGTNKLSNGGLDLGDLYWETREDTRWIYTAPGNARVSGAPTEDDVLASSESWPVRPGQEYRQSLRATRNAGSSTTGRLRLRRVYKGRFKHPDLAVGYDQWTAGSWGDITISTDPTKVMPGQSHVLKIHTPDRELLTNNSFDNGLTGWQDEQVPPDNWGTFAAPDGFAARTIGGPDPVKGLRGLNLIDGAGPDFFFPVVEGEEYALGGWISQEAGTNGNASISAYLGASSGAANLSGVWENAIEKVGSGDLNWYHDHTTISIRDKPVATHLRPTLLVFNHTTGAWLFDNVYLFRTRGNNDLSIANEYVPVVPGRRYTAKVRFRSDPKVTGTVQLRALCFGPGREAVTIQGPTLQASEGILEEAYWDIVAPSGYDLALPLVFSQDVKGPGFFWVGEWTIRDSDETTKLLEVKTTAAHAVHTPSVDGVVPTGAESMTIEVVAEDDAAWFTLDTVDIRRINVVPSTGNAIVASLLAGLPFTTGTVNCPEVIPYDWHVLNLTPRQAFEHYCNVVSEPRREYRVNPDRSVDVATATDSTVFADLGPANALLREDIDVEDLPIIEADVEGRVIHIKVIGAERTRPDGSRYNIEATAAVPGTPEYDPDGNLVRRTRLVTDGTVDHLGYAQALADDLAAKEAEPALSVDATLTGVNTRPAFREGDWIYVYDPEAGLEDVDNATTIEGRTVFPRKVRVFSRTRELGPSHRIDIRRTDGTTFTLAGVRWSDKDATSLTIGDRRPDWQSDPQGHSAAVQYMRDRISAPR